MWRLLFGLSAPVDRRTYALAGFGLMLAKYVVDALLVNAVAHVVWTPFDYMNPLFSPKQAKIGPGNEWLLLVLGLWTLPFVWIGLSMTIRRMHDAGFPASLGLFYFVPGVNYVVMLALCLTPTKAPRHGATPARAEPLGPLWSRGLIAILVGLAAIAALFVVCVYALRSYGTALFIGAPFLFGALSAFLYNKNELRPVSESLLLSILGIVVAGGSLLLLVLEGGICIAMAAPVALVMAGFGALVGRSLAEFRESTVHAVALPPLLLLGTAWGEAALTKPAQYEVQTAVQIAAPPATVWRNVVSFSELPEPDWALFKLGVAYPMRATITGSGVGAVRRCEFSTGAFVEPITTWEEPRRLAFDVAEQPQSMHEWTLYGEARPPHLDGYIRSHRGEFRLVPTEDGGTRLEGSTWYELRFGPTLYWHLWSDFFLHRIHSRVLEHIKSLSERAA